MNLAFNPNLEFPIIQLIPRLVYIKYSGNSLILRLHFLKTLELNHKKE